MWEVTPPGSAIRAGGLGRYLLGRWSNAIGEDPDARREPTAVAEVSLSTVGSPSGVPVCTMAALVFLARGWLGRGEVDPEGLLFGGKHRELRRRDVGDAATLTPAGCALVVCSALLRYRSWGTGLTTTYTRWCLRRLA